MIKLLIADSSVLVRTGFRALLEDVKDFNFIAESDTADDLKLKIKKYKPQVLIIDFNSILFPISELKTIRKQDKELKILAITQLLGKAEMKFALENGVTSYLLKDCDKEEIKEAVYKTRDGERFLCGKVAEVLMADPEVSVTPAYLKTISCAGFGVTEREIDIVKLIAEGYSNKQIADKLCLSTHTVNTHRKNIMSKLGVNNTAGIVLYAVKNHLLEPNTFLFS
ncbi:MAG TPA: response regulator transcription factor [Nitrosopumilaceae archaeon]|nr:response regulator transcription factor [Nitrosopumilaceae archaeon]